MVKYTATIVGLGLAVAFVVVFFAGRTETRHLDDIAPRVGMSYDDLMALGPRVASTTGVTLGTSRHVVYLLACSGRSSRLTIESQAAQATTLARSQRLSDREAVIAVLSQNASGAGTTTAPGAATPIGADLQATPAPAALGAATGAASLKDC